jgi:hypothetical protein
MVRLVKKPELSCRVIRTVKTDRRERTAWTVRRYLKEVRSFY